MFSQPLSGVDLYLEAVLLFEKHFVMWRFLLLHIVLLLNPASPCFFRFDSSFLSSSLSSHMLSYAARRSPLALSVNHFIRNIFHLKFFCQYQCFQTFFQNTQGSPLLQLPIILPHFLLNLYH